MFFDAFTDHRITGYRVSVSEDCNTAMTARMRDVHPFCTSVQMMMDDGELIGTNNQSYTVGRYHYSINDLKLMFRFCFPIYIYIYTVHNTQLDDIVDGNRKSLCVPCGKFGGERILSVFPRLVAQSRHRLPKYCRPKYQRLFFIGAPVPKYHVNPLLIISLDGRNFGDNDTSRRASVTFFFFHDKKQKFHSLTR